MTDIEKAVFLQTQAVCAMLEAAAIIIQRIDESRGEYGPNQILQLIKKYGIGRDDVLAYLVKP